MWKKHLLIYIPTIITGVGLACHYFSLIERYEKQCKEEDEEYERWKKIKKNK